MKKRLLASLIGVLIAFGAIEVGVRFTQPHVDLEGRSGKRAGSHPMADWAHIDAFCAYRGIPGTYPNTEGKKTVNSEGFISTPEVPFKKRDDTLRIAFLGGSSTACSVPPLPDTQTWPWMVAEKIRKETKSRKVDFINAGLPGYSTFESYGRLWSRLRFYKPDIVVVYHGWNEMYYFLDPTWLRHRHVPHEKNWSFERKAEERTRTAKPIDPFISWSQTLVHIRTRFFSDPLRGEAPRMRKRIVNRFDPKAVEIFRTNLKLMIDAQEIFGFKLFAAKQATLIVGSRNDWNYHGFSHDAHVEAFQAVYRVLDEELPAAQVLDVSHLSGNTDVLVDHIHLSAEGCRQVAASISKQLLASPAWPGNDVQAAVSGD